jgi:hypothetical protein
MEALAGIALAGNALQFVGLAYRLVCLSGAVKRSHDGSIKDHSELNIVISNLDKHIQSLHATADPELQPLIAECKSVALELKAALQKAKGSPGKHVWSSYAQALRCMWSESKLKDSTQRERERETGHRTVCAASCGFFHLSCWTTNTAHTRLLALSFGWHTTTDWLC